MSKQEERFAHEKNVDAQRFDWGELAWLSKPGAGGTQRFGACVVTLEPGKGHDRHSHPGIEEMLFVLEGAGVQIIAEDDGIVECDVGPGTLIHLPPGADHSTINTGETPMRLLAIYAPPSSEDALKDVDGEALEPPGQKG